MSISLRVTLLIALITSLTDCAPKLGHILFEPLIYEAYDSRKNRNIASNVQKESNNADIDFLGANLPMPSSNTKVINKTTKVVCSGYDYDVNICKIISDRLLCGYNKNIGDLTPKIIDLGNGCRMRNKRLECGYISRPFDRLRRPPENNYNMDTFSTSSQFPLVSNPQMTSVYNDNKLSSSKKYYLEINTNANFKSTKNTNENILRMISSIKTSTSIPTTIKLLLLRPTISSEKVNRNLEKHCVETRDSIFCYSTN